MSKISSNGIETKRCKLCNDLLIESYDDLYNTAIGMDETDYENMESENLGMTFDPDMGMKFSCQKSVKNYINETCIASKLFGNMDECLLCGPGYFPYYNSMINTSECINNKEIAQSVINSDTEFSEQISNCFIHDNRRPHIPVEDTSSESDDEAN